MKRPYSKTFDSSPVDDIRKDIPPLQLAAIGAVTLSYNYAENSINRMLAWTIGMPISSMHREIVSRINGVDGKIAIVKKGAMAIGVPENIRIFLAEALGEGGFSLLKKYRDAVIHARIFNKDVGIGEFIESKGRHTEVLLSQVALDGLYDHLEALRREMAALQMVLFEAFRLYWEVPVDPEKSQLEAKIQERFAQAQFYRSQRLSLPPIPGFPSGEELSVPPTPEQQVQQDTLMGWFQPLSEPVPSRPLPGTAAIMDQNNAPPLPPMNEGKEKE